MDNSRVFRLGVNLQKRAAVANLHQQVPAVGFKVAIRQLIVCHLGLWCEVIALREQPWRNPRCHPEKQINALKRSISKFGVTRPLLVDERNTILCGHGCHQAAKQLGLAEVPTLALMGLTPAQKRALVIADNRVAEGSVWDTDLLKVHFKDLITQGFDVELTRGTLAFPCGC